MLRTAKVARKLSQPNLKTSRKLSQPIKTNIKTNIKRKNYEFFTLQPSGYK
ncbi:MAG: hypothetical protein SPH77_05260 [Campylobacter sp.]|uniref:hypothetical protein n=1 Tax=Campylobacter sp. TaxID=205 RepID=UPI002A8D8D74|nr:hypothetical protein [Campylobacter sp.]MCI6177850.1 hypothetical protein [Campylobacter sp.]MDY3663420.1 hypothetical protein [Campylobacter sp.]MDY6188222.1 hypothetical protein [Campylobacter sp.]